LLKSAPGDGAQPSLAVGLAGILPADKARKRQARCLSSPQPRWLCPETV